MLLSQKKITLARFAYLCFGLEVDRPITGGRL